MKRKVNSFQPLKSLLLAGLLAAPMLAFNAMAQGRTDIVWSPLDFNPDGVTANYADPQNWTGGRVPVDIDTNTTPTSYDNAAYNDNVSAIHPCIITNDTVIGQIMAGFGGAGVIVITNGAHVRAGFGTGQWTGIGYVAGPGTLIVGPGCDFTCASHLWVGQGANQGTVIIDGGSIHIPNGQLGVGWNGGTNYIFLTNGAQLFMQQWQDPTLGYPGNTNLGGVGFMDLADNNCSVVSTNDNTHFFNTLVTNHQLSAYGGAGTVTWNYNPALNITTINAVAPVDPNTPVITAQPTNVVASPGGSASFHVQISNVSVNYQWFFNGNPLTDGSGITGSQMATLTISGVTPARSGSYFVMATNSTHADHFVMSSSASLSSMGINLYPVITVNGVPGKTYVAQYTASLSSPNWIPFATNTVNSFAPLYVVDTSSPMAVTRFYRVIQQ